MVEPIVVSDLKMLRKVVLAAIEKDGPRVDLNHIDVGGVDTFDGLFKDTGFCGDVSRWNMEKAVYTTEMFMGTPFNGDVSKWNFKKLYHTRDMFRDSLFNGDVSQWDVRKMLGSLEYRGMFQNGHFAQDLSAWNIANVLDDVRNVLIVGINNSSRMLPTPPGMKETTPMPMPTPAFLREKSLKDYAKLFGGPALFGEYLAKRPFGIMHFDVCCASDTCPAGVAQEDFEWSRELFAVGTALGLDNTALRGMCVGQLGARGTKAAESFALDGLVR